jgi:hypothetical protein
MNYTIEIAETLSQSVTVQAATAEEAISIVRRLIVRSRLSFLQTTMLIRISVFLTMHLILRLTASLKSLAGICLYRVFSKTLIL